MISAIETKYNGYRFRSRTEAKWAVFFDAAGIPYAYEAQSFILDGIPYLPDFWLPGFKMWFEVKGVDPTPDEILKAKLLCKETGNTVLVCEGSPETHGITVVEYDEEIGGITKEWGLELLDDRRTEGEFWLYSDNHGYSIGPIYGPYHEKCPARISACLRGVNAAKAARFEFGETPRP